MLPAGVGAPINKTMEDLIAYTERLRKIVDSYQGIFKESYPDIKAFNTISHLMTMVLEQLKYYQWRWIVLKKKNNLELEHVERLHHVLTWTYVQSFSIVEYHTKGLVKKRGKKCLKNLGKLTKRKRFPFSHFIDESKNDNLIDDDEKLAWHFLREIRNATVHNNGFFDEKNHINYNLGDRVVYLGYRQNEPMMGNLDFD